MGRYIDADEFVRAIKRRSTHWYSAVGVLAVIDEQETVDVNPITHSYWEKCGNGKNKIFRCHNCGKFKSYETNYCQDCGAKMDEKSVMAQT